MATSRGQEWEIAEPRAEAMIESMRSFGYSPETAIADLVDNSISANATQVDIDFVWNGNDSIVTVRDNGRGMSDQELVEAMRPGSTSPTEQRARGDLGRFGLGLKTASFSQARELTVVSLPEGGGGSCIRRWDLDTVVQTGQWRLLRSLPEGHRLQTRGIEPSGTEVIWTKCDRLVQGADRLDHRAQNRFLRIVDKVNYHLAAVFHRYLSGKNRVHIRINGVEVKPWDPFLKSHPATASIGREQLPLAGQLVSISPYILPHRSKLSPEDAAAAAGTSGWNHQQGFYVYRENRLLVAGGWLGLGFSNEEHTKLARISVDFPAQLDSFWQIDVKKSTARPPGALIDDLKRIASATRRNAEEVYRHRGKQIMRSNTKPYVMAWTQVKKRDGTIKYQVNRANPVVAQVLEDAGSRRRSIEHLLRFVEETVPTTMIGIAIADSVDHQKPPFENHRSELGAILRELYGKMKESGSEPREIIEILAATEPFAGYPELIVDLEDSIK